MTQVIVEVSGTQVAWMEGSLKVQDTLDQRSTCTFVVLDTTGTQHYQPGQPVLVQDQQNGLLFTGYIDNSQEKNLYPQPHILSTIACIDQHYLADKRVAQKNYANQYAGDIAADLLHTYLAAEGVNLSNLASRSDHYQADWGQGALSGVVAASNVGDGNLELSPAGNSTSYAQQASGDFSGPATFLSYNSALQGVTFPPTQSMCLSGVQGIAGVGNAFVYVKFWQGSYLIPSGAVLAYDIWIPDSCPQQMAGIDLVFTDGSTLRDMPIYPTTGGIYPDQQGVGAHPGNDLSGLATNQWYHRNLPLYGSGTLVGKTLAYATLAFEGDNTGNYVAYVRNVSVASQTLFAGSLLTGAPQQLQTSGYSQVQLTVATTYEVTGSMESTTFDTTSAGIYNTSLLQWQETDATNCTIAVSFSADNGATFQPCANNASLPALLPGQSLSGIKTLFQYVFTNAGNDPTQTPILSSVQAVVNPSYSCTKSDVVAGAGNGVGWLNGTSINTLLSINSELTLNGVMRTWDDADMSSQTMFGGNGPGPYINRKTFEIRLNDGSPNWGISRFDFAGQWQNFTAEIDVNVTTAGDEYGLVYRTTGWQNTNDTYGYSVFVSTQQVLLGYGTNTSTGSGLFQQIAAVNITLATGNWHRLKVVVNGTNHKVYLDNTLYINVTDSTYTAAGYIGARGYSPTANYDLIQFDNFGVCAALSGQWVSPAFNLSGLGNLTNSQITALLDPTANLSLCSLLIEISLNNGSTWTTCPQVQAATSNQVLVSAVPGLTAGTNVGTITQAQVRLTISTSTTSVQGGVLGIMLTAIGQYSSSGSRIAPSSSLSGIGVLGSSAITWNGLVPANTSMFVDSSLDGVNFTQVGQVVDSTPGNAQIAGLSGQPDPTQDQFNANSSSNYTQTFQTGGAAATYTWDTTNSRLIAAAGTDAILLYQGIQAANLTLMTVLDQADAGGFTWCFADASDFYALIVADASAASNPNTVILNKISGNVTNRLASGNISFTRGTPHSVQMTMNNGVITVQFDSAQVFSYTDSTPLASGQCGLFSNGGTEYFYQLLIQPLGQTVTAPSAYTRIRMTTTDPTQTPQITDLTLSAHAPIIGKGILITKANYSVLPTQNTTNPRLGPRAGRGTLISAALDDLAKQSNYKWRINRNKDFVFAAAAVTQAPRIIQSSEMLLSTVRVTNITNQYRNSQWVTGAVNTISDTDSFVGDGKKRSFILKYPVYSISSITVDGAAQLVGVKGTDTGKQWYYSQNSASISQDISLFPLLKTQTLVVAYEGQYDTSINEQSSAAIAARAAMDGTSGIVEAVESAPELLASAAQNLANARLGEYAVQGKQLRFTTNTPGLAVGQQATIFVPQYGIKGMQFLITNLGTTYKTVMQNGAATLLPYYSIKAVYGAMLYDWTHYFQTMGN